MLVHLAAFSWRDDVSEEEADRLLEGVHAIAHDVKGARAVYAGPNVSEYGRGLTHAVLLLADDTAAHRAYREHPAHVAAARRMNSFTVITGSQQPGIVVDLIV